MLFCADVVMEDDAQLVGREFPFSQRLHCRTPTCTARSTSDNSSAHTKKVHPDCRMTAPNSDQSSASATHTPPHTAMTSAAPERKVMASSSECATWRARQAVRKTTPIQTARAHANSNTALASQSFPAQ